MKKYKITALKHINLNKTSVSAHYKCDEYSDSIDRSYIFFETSYNKVTTPFACEDMSLGIWIINDPISFKTLMSCFNENAYYFLKRKYPDKEN